MAGTIVQHMKRTQRQILFDAGIEVVDTAPMPVAEDPTLRPVLIPPVASNLLNYSGPFWLFPTGDFVAAPQDAWLSISHPGWSVAVKTLGEELRFRAKKEAVRMTAPLWEAVVCEHVRVVCGSKRRMKIVDKERITERDLDRLLRACTRLVPQ